MAKLWLSLASWSSDLGEKVLESCQKGSGIVLTEDERQSVLEGLPQVGIRFIELEHIIKLKPRLHTKFTQPMGTAHRTP